MRNALLAATLLCTIQSNAQTLFTYGKHAVSEDEFLKAYNKNNTDTSGEKISYTDYLELYSRFKLKVQDALDARIDTIESLDAELKAFRYQLAENYMKEDATIALLVDEAAERLKKDIHITIDNQEIGWITAFVLPYEIETLIYNTAPGNSASFKTANGEHTIQNVEEREAVGQVRIAQILLAFRPDATEAGKQILAQRADSIYNALAAGADFGEMVEKYTNDNLTYETKGEIPLFGVGKYDAVFERAAFGLEKDNDISKPFTTRFGYHILKRLGRVPATDNKDEIKEKVLASDRPPAIPTEQLRAVGVMPGLFHPCLPFPRPTHSEPPTCPQKDMFAAPQLSSSHVPLSCRQW